MNRRVLAVVFGAAIGVVFSAVAWAVWPHHYVATAVVAFHYSGPHTAADDQKVESFIDSIGTTAWAEDRLAAIASRHHTSPADLKQSVAIRSTGGTTPERWEISFTSSNPEIVQSAVADLTSSLIDFNTGPLLFPSAACPGAGVRTDPAKDTKYQPAYRNTCLESFEPVQGASLPRDQRPRPWRFGLIGAIAGAMAALISVRRWLPATVE